MVLKRLFIGNLHQDIQEDDLRSRFKSFGDVKSVEVRSKNEAVFAFIDVDFGDDDSGSGSGNLRKCIDVLNNTKWKGLVLKVQLAKESFIDKLKKEREQNGGANHRSFASFEREKARQNFRPKPPDNFDFEIVTPGAAPVPQSQKIVEPKARPKPKEKASPTVFNNFLNIPIIAPSASLISEPVVPGGPSPPAKKRKKVESSSDSSESESESETERGGIPKFRGLGSYPGLLESKICDVISQKILIADPASKSKKTPAPALPPKSKSEEITVLASAPKPKITPAPASTPEKSKSEEIPSPAPTPVPKVPFQLKLNPHKKSQSEKLRAQSLMSKEKILESRSNVIRSALDKIDIKIAPVSTTAKAEDSKYLFGDDEEHEDVETSSFKIKPQFEGETGQKNLNLKMKSSFINDERFKLDTRFADGGDEKSVENEANPEKSTQLEILSGIVGPLKPTTPKVPAPPIDIKAMLPFVRFDPTKPAHQIFRKDYQENPIPTPAAITTAAAEDPKPSSPKKAKKKKPKEIEKEIETQKANLLNPTAKPTYKIAENLKNLFSSSSTADSGDKNSGGFSLLQTFGKSVPEEDSYSTEKISKKVTKNSKKFQGLNGNIDKNPFKYDSSSEDEAEEPTKAKKSKAPPSAPALKKNYFKQDLFKKDSLLFKPNDSRLDGVFTKFLQSTEDLAEVTQKFNDSERAELKLIAKSKWKNSRRKSEKRIKVMKLIRKKKRRDAHQHEVNRQKKLGQRHGPGREQSK